MVVARSVAWLTTQITQENFNWLREHVRQLSKLSINYDISNAVYTGSAIYVLCLFRRFFLRSHSDSSKFENVLFLVIRQTKRVSLSQHLATLLSNIFPSQKGDYDQLNTRLLAKALYVCHVFFLHLGGYKINQGGSKLQWNPDPILRTPS